MPATHRTFQPKALANREALVGFTVISRQYFKVANDLFRLSQTNTQANPGHFYVFPSVVLYVAAFEAFLQEQLAFSRFATEQSKDEASQDLLTKLDSLKNQSGPYQDFKIWVKEIYRSYDPKNQGFNTDNSEYQDLIALKELRNSVVHYNPLFIEVASWPARLEQALQRTKIEVLNAGWVTNFSRPEVAQWAHDTIRNAIQLFSHISGAQDPFAVVLDRDGVPPWE